MNRFHKEYNIYKKKYIVEKISRIATNNEINKDKICGTIHGCIYGDAFGARYEFLTKDESNAKIELDKDETNGFYPIKGGGPFKIKIDPGQVTDDSEMMFGLMDSIIELGYYDQKDVATRYIKWFETNPIDYGRTIQRAICTRKKAESNADMIDNSIQMNKYSLSNGTLMRICPLGILGLMLSDKELWKCVKQECNLTHPNKLVKDMCYIYCLAIKYAILGLNKDDIFKLVLNTAIYPRTKITLKDAVSSPEPCYTIDEVQRKEVYVDTDNKTYQGYIGVALQNAFYELMNGSDPNKSVVDIARRGGDTDTNCAITGALLGAYYGASKFDSRWYETIKHSSENTERYKTYPFLQPLDKMEVKCSLLYNLVKN